MHIKTFGILRETQTSRTFTITQILQQLPFATQFIFRESEWIKDITSYLKEIFHSIWTETEENSRANEAV